MRNGLSSMSNRTKIHIIVLGLAVLIAIGGYVCLDSVFPKAADISCPEAKDITSIIVETDDGSAIENFTGYKEILQFINSAKPTRKQSVNDTPAVKPYYLIRINTAEPEYLYYVYESGAQPYIEIPYQGIYEADQNAIVFLSGQFSGE